jgi:hypothetical protein
MSGRSTDTPTRTQSICRRTRGDAPHPMKTHLERSPLSPPGFLMLTPRGLAPPSPQSRSATCNSHSAAARPQSPHPAPPPCILSAISQTTRISSTTRSDRTCCSVALRAMPTSFPTSRAATRSLLGVPFWKSGPESLAPIVLLPLPRRQRPPARPIFHLRRTAGRPPPS